MNKETLIAKIRKEFPDVRFKHATLVTKGWDHDVLILDKRYIFRFAKQQLNKKSFIRETKFLKKFSKVSNLTVPRYRWLSKDKTFGGYEIIRGRELTPNLFKRLSGSKKQKFVAEIAAFVSRLHSTPLSSAKRYGFPSYSSWKQEARERRRWFKNEFENKVAPKLTSKQSKFIRDFAKYFYYSDYAVRPVLAHYDLSHDHIIMTAKGGISGIIDFGDLRIGDPAQEFNGFVDYDNDLPKQIYKLYRGYKDRDFLQRCREHYIHRWIYLLYDAHVRRKDKKLWREAVQRINKIIREEGKKYRGSKVIH